MPLLGVGARLAVQVKQRRQSYILLRNLFERCRIVERFVQFIRFVQHDGGSGIAHSFFSSHKLVCIDFVSIFPSSLYLELHDDDDHHKQQHKPK
ncbi:hypothetical protein ElyMa_003965900 [Elysia marginata]|uniref:Uncharacterized protein n=1 Tax=Elysia marginata TaxID=1093978 RepID=A0AAV4FVT6_9GAST|nr:hypothetical protein ElyMa_003965900 [Elysia marginata]